MSKRALGKGLEALIREDVMQERGSLVEVPIERIKANDDQPRKTFNQEALKELSESIKQQGILQPIIAEKRDDEYLIVAGERRYRAAKLAGLPTIPVIVSTYSDSDRLLISLVENIQREDLNPIEEAEALASLLTGSAMNQDKLAKMIGKSRSSVANSLRLLNLTEDMRASLENGNLSPGHARAVLSLDTREQRETLFRQIISERISVREAENRASRINRPNKPKSASQVNSQGADPDLMEVEQRLIEVLGTKVKVRGSAQKGMLEISFYSEDDLNRLYQLIVGEE